MIEIIAYCDIIFKLITTFTYTYTWTFTFHVSGLFKLGYVLRYTEFYFAVWSVNQY